MMSPVKILRNQKKIRNLLGQEGEIVTYTTVFVPPSGFESQAPYVVVVVQLINGKKITAQLVDFDEQHLSIGQKVKTILRRTKDPGEEGIIPYGIKCTPI